jgi:hypothetical protein
MLLLLLGTWMPPRESGREFGLVIPPPLEFAFAFAFELLLMPLPVLRPLMTEIIDWACSAAELSCISEWCECECASEREGVVVPLKREAVERKSGKYEKNVEIRGLISTLFIHRTKNSRIQNSNSNSTRILKF